MLRTRQYVANRANEEPPLWFGYVCGITAIVGMVSIAVLLTSLAFGRCRREERRVDDQSVG